MLKGSHPSPQSKLVIEFLNAISGECPFAMQYSKARDAQIAFGRRSSLNRHLERANTRRAQNAHGLNPSD